MSADRDNWQAGFAQALAELRAGRFERAEALAQDLLRAAPRNPAVHQLRSAIAFQDGRHRDAIASARSCLDIQPLHAPAMLMAGRAARASGDNIEAASWFRRAWQASPGKPEALFCLGAAQLACGDAGAQATLENAWRLFPGYCEGWNELGMALRKAAQLEAAALAFARAADGSTDPAHSFNHGAVLKALGRHGEAIAAFRKALAIEPDHAAAMLALAQCLRIMGEGPEARRLLQRLAIVQPGNGQALFALGLVCDDMHDLPGTLAAYRACLALQPEWPEALVNLGMALQQAGELELAVQSYRAAVRVRRDTFARIAQALPSARQGQLWLNLGKLRRSLEG